MYTPCWYGLFDPRTKNLRVLSAFITENHSQCVSVNVPSLNRVKLDYPKRLPPLRGISPTMVGSYQAALVRARPQSGPYPTTLVIAMVVGNATKDEATRIACQHLSAFIGMYLGLDAKAIHTQLCGAEDKANPRKRLNTAATVN